MKKIIISVVLVVLLISVGVYFLTRSSSDTITNTQDQNGVENIDQMDEEQEVVVEDETRTVIGSSVEGREIVAYHYGEGDKEVVFVGGIHGGYSWNTALVAYELMNYLETDREAVPANVKVTVIPVLNPDGLYKVAGKVSLFTKADIATSQAVVTSGRFNANNVDLNRNFDCDWQENAVWQSQSVSGGSSAFSEPESQAFRDYVTANSPESVVVWYSAAGGVFASNCHNGVLSETTALTNTFAKASGYPAYQTFNFYEITGDAVNWLAKNNIPAISVLLTNHQDVEWNKNKAGIDALLEYYAE